MSIRGNYGQQQEGGTYLYQEKEPQQHRIQAAAKIHNTYLYKMCFFESQTL